jgi:single-strand DNA-binding protein
MNSITITGNLGADPEMKYTQSGVPVTSFNVATNKKWKDGEGNQKEKVTWFRVSVWRGQAEACHDHLHKGSKVLVVGEVEAPKAYINNAGEAAASLDITATTVEFLSGQEDGGAQRSKPAGSSASDKDIPF